MGEDRRVGWGGGGGGANTPGVCVAQHTLQTLRMLNPLSSKRGGGGNTPSVCAAKHTSQRLHMLNPLSSKSIVDSCIGFW